MNYRYIFIKDIIVISLIISLPFIYFIYDVFPVSNIFETPFFIFKTTYFENVNYFVWVLLGKLMILAFIIIWFISCKHVWRYFLFFPFMIEFYRIFGAFNDEFNFLPQSSMIGTFFFSLPFSMALILIINKISNFINKIDVNSLGKSIDCEISDHIGKIANTNITLYKVIKSEYNDLINEIYNEDSPQYLKRLSDLKSKIKLIINGHKE
ncbi:MAG: hypothetical protein HKO61_06275 [Flavobacteriaceae bacterium]|nr:hypothetical protein [Flavobacteriaceae bacterium]